ncbi:unnamed protein product [Auanema sp. JU1783]|nr:unnamed protein product [Auanema sp. JU1783]
MSNEKGDTLWQCRDIRFDVDHRMLRLIPGECLIDRLDNVEDTKGNNGERGVIRITNLRVIWHSATMTRVNLSIGYGCITGMQTKRVQSKIRGVDTEALFMLARVRESQTKFEFIFTSVTSSLHARLFNTISSVLRSYETTKLYRELKMRGAIIDDNEDLKLLPGEQMCERLSGVWNLSHDQGTLGVFVITNLRIVWFAQTNTNYNVSIPYLQLFGSKLRDSKFGPALVLETTTASGEYVLGFRIDPSEKMHATCKMIHALHKNQFMNPVYGVTFKFQAAGPTPETEAIDHLEDDIEVEEKQLRTDAFAAYFTQGTTSNHDEKRPPVFSENLGLAVEQLKSGFTIEDLWTVHVE